MGEDRTIFQPSNTEDSIYLHSIQDSLRST